MFTSGTTGPSKGVIIKHHCEWAFGVTIAEIVDIRADDVAYNFLPFFHVAGKFVLVAALMVDAHMILRQRLSVARFWPDIREFGCTITVAVGCICHMLNADCVRDDDADNPLRVIYAVPIPAEFQAEFENRFGLVFIEGYGSTKANIVAASTPASARTAHSARQAGSTRSKSTTRTTTRARRMCRARSACAHAARACYSPATTSCRKRAWRRHAISGSTPATRE